MWIKRPQGLGSSFWVKIIFLSDSSLVEKAKFAH